MKYLLVSRITVNEVRHLLALLDPDSVAEILSRLIPRLTKVMTPNAIIIPEDLSAISPGQITIIATDGGALTQLLCLKAELAEQVVATT